MANCKERNFDDLLSVLAVPVSGVSFSNAAKRFAPTLQAGDYTLAAAGTIYIGRATYKAVGNAAITPAYSIPIMSESGEVDDEEKVSVGGRKHQVRVTFEVGASTTAERAALLRLERGEWALELCFFGDTDTEPCRALVQATRDTCLVTVKRDGKKVSVTIEIDNLMGLQVVE